MKKELIINISPDRKLFKWGPIEFRLFYGSFFMNTIWLKIHKLYSWSWPSLLSVFKNGKVTMVLDDGKLRASGMKYFNKYFLNQENFRKHWQKYLEWIEQFKIFIKKLEKVNLSEINDDQLVVLFEKYFDLQKKFWLIAHVPEIANLGGERMFLNKLNSINKDKAEAELEILSTPDKYSFFQKEELELLKIGLIKDERRMKSVLDRHAKKYSWLLNSYGGNRLLDSKYFENRLNKSVKRGNVDKQIRKIQNVAIGNKRRKEKLLQKFNKEIKVISKQLSYSIWWQDHRKSYIWRMHYWDDRLLKEISKRKEVSYNDLVWFWPKEICDLLKGKKINENTIRLRKKDYVVYYKDKSTRYKEYYGKDAKFIYNKYLKSQVNILYQEIKGLVVSQGKSNRIIGRVAIIRNPFRDKGKMKQGDILVAGMTSPEFIVLIKKAKAIITDQGGMTSHVAIISRELGIPCVVGTDIATKILKNGDKIEIDIRQGKINKIL